MPDARVQAAIDHWAPRIITAGVDYNDFARTTGRIEGSLIRCSSRSCCRCC